ncbi:MAG: hypothetical protein A2259_02815 [Candidatus Moranbacteria bacterium RIFOXYA2_FULL_43_15]|nr:MAG: hypothetical protein A2259_02815 [Candidatus Moranbacteria bacterium RIFOXYA2_FULL_43_15]
MWLPRTIFPKIWEKIDSEEILLLNGARQVGKTTILKMIGEKLVSEKKIDPKKIHWFDLEDANDLANWSEQNSIFPLLPLDDKEKHYIFIDEFQRSKNIGSILKVLHDHHPNLKIIITRSASWYLNIDESLVGRKQVFEIWPLNFEEFVLWQNDTNFSALYNQAKNNIKTTPQKIIEAINQRFLDFLRFGGYPAVILRKTKEEKIVVLTELLNAYLTRDIQLWNYAANTLQVKKILTLLASFVGSPLNISNLSKNAEISRTITQNRLELLQNTFILHLISPYFSNKTRELTKSPKVYLVDNGLRNILLSNFSVLPQTADFGYLVENFVAGELLKKSSAIEQILFWQTIQGQEVDIVKKSENIILPIEIKSGAEKSISSGLKLFIFRYNPTTAYLLNWSTVKNIKHNDTEILFRPLWFPIK